MLTHVKKKRKFYDISYTKTLMPSVLSDQLLDNEVTCIFAQQLGQQKLICRGEIWIKSRAFSLME